MSYSKAEQNSSTSQFRKGILVDYGRLQYTLGVAGPEEEAKIALVNQAVRSPGNLSKDQIEALFHFGLIDDRTAPLKRAAVDAWHEELSLGRAIISSSAKLNAD